MPAAAASQERRCRPRGLVLRCGPGLRTEESELALHQSRHLSAEGAEYESHQRQAPNNVRRVAPGSNPKDVEALKERTNSRRYFALSVLAHLGFFVNVAGQLSTTIIGV